MSLSAMMGRQLPFVSVFLPAYTLTIFAGFRDGLMDCWPVATVAGLVFALVQAVFANWVGPELPDLIAGLISLISVIGFVQYWKPPYRSEYEANMDFLLVSDESVSVTVEKSKKINDQSILNQKSNDEKIRSSSSTASKKSDDLTSTKRGMIEEQGENTASSYLSSEDVSSIKNDSIIQQGDTQSHISIATTSTTMHPNIERLNWKETSLAWSPWVFVVVVVMM